MKPTLKLLKAGGQLGEDDLPEQIEPMLPNSETVKESQEQDEPEDEEELPPTVEDFIQSQLNGDDEVEPMIHNI